MTVNSNIISLPSGMGMSERTDKNGKSRGVVLSFVGNKTAAQLKEEGRAAGLSGNKLKMFVNKSLAGDKAAAWIRFNALTSAMQSSGVVPIEMIPNKKGDVFKAEFRLVDSEDAKAKELESAQKELALLTSILKAKGCTDEEIAKAKQNMGL